MREIQVHKVERGSIIVLSGVSTGEDGIGGHLVTEIARVVGHRDFLVIEVATDGALDYIGAADAAEWVRGRFAPEG